jgi:hypothetical protein
MEASQSTLFTLLYIAWGAVTVVLVVLLSYRATLLREDDQILVDSGEPDHLQREKTIIARRSLLAGEIIVLSLISGALLLTCVGFTIY